MLQTSNFCQCLFIYLLLYFFFFSLDHFHVFPFNGSEWFKRKKRSIYVGDWSFRIMACWVSVDLMLQDSFEIPRGQASRGGDIELGAQASMNSGELGLESFFKQVLWLDFCLPWTSWEDKRSMSFASFSFCIYLIIHLYMGFIKLISMVLPS